MRPSPEVVFEIDENDPSFVKHQYRLDEQYVEYMMMKDLSPSLPDANTCDSITRDRMPIFAVLKDSRQKLIFDSRLALRNNTLEDTIEDGGGELSETTLSSTRCSNAPMTFLNEKTCRVSKSEKACTNQRISGHRVDITLNRNTIIDFQKSTGRYIYAVTGLADRRHIGVGKPCVKNNVSRWMRLPNGSPCPAEGVHSDTLAAWRDLIRSSADRNPYTKNIYSAGKCHINDIDRLYFNVEVDGVCYKMVDAREYNVYDFTDWVTNHPGGPDKITYFAEQGSEFLIFPHWHDMKRWQDNKSKFPFFGRVGDVISFNSLPEYFRKDYAENVKGLFKGTLSGAGVVVCGSPSEVANVDPHTVAYPMARNDMNESTQWFRKDYLFSRKKVWSGAALRSVDQVRQRMAWALSQLLAVSSATFQDTPYSNEMYTVYYDIFVRNAFGNYRDVLREVSYSPLMAHMLTFYDSKSQEYNWETTKEIQHADENYAREIMQLFTIGLNKLNMDGTAQVDDNGEKIRTYTNGDIEEYARSWTGFVRQRIRGNIEEQYGGFNMIDPMRIMVEKRDDFPKMGLNGKHIGDEYMLCSDLPSRAFLRKGATYRLLGKSKESSLQHIPTSDKQGDFAVTILSSDSNLRTRLCSDRESECQFPSLVTLDESLTCKGAECNLVRLQIVQVSENIYYEYLRPPCVEFAFFSPGHLVTWGDPKYGSRCVSRTSQQASAACCPNKSDVAIHDTCNYFGERFSVDEAERRCAERGRKLCQFDSVSSEQCGDCCDYEGRYWYKGGERNDGWCEIIIVVRPDGRVAFERSGRARSDYNTLTYFRVHWGEKGFPSRNNNCANNNCETIGSYCRCKINSTFRDVFDYAPSKKDVLMLLHVGAIPPTLIDYTSVEIRGDVKIHFTSQGVYNKDTMFEVEDRFGRTLYLKNIDDTIQIRGGSATYFFRNPPTFNPNLVPETR